MTGTGRSAWQGHKDPNNKQTLSMHSVRTEIQGENEKFPGKVWALVLFRRKTKKGKKKKGGSLSEKKH